MPGKISAGTSVVGGGGNFFSFLNRFMFNLNGDERKTVYLIAILINRFKKKMLCYTIFFK